MKLEMICTGEEVLSGQIVDTNAAWLGNQLMESGFEMHRRTTVGDRLSDLVDIFNERSLVADIILVNGGLGPTADDLSALAMAKAMGVELVEDKTWRARLVEWAKGRNITLSDSNLKQALLPEGAIMVDNPVGSACGFRVKFNNAWLFFTPGVPHEYKTMVTEQFIPFVKSESAVRSHVEVTKLLCIGIGESDMAEQLETLDWPQGITLGYRSYTPYLELKLIARDVPKAQQTAAMLQAKSALKDCVVAQDKNTLAAEVHHLLSERNATLAVAESLTGGDICNQLVAYPGSSHYLKQGVVSYCNEAKMSLLKVTEKSIAEETEVSMICAAQMALGTANANTLINSTDYAIATTGIAGPQGGTDALPVGTVVIAVKAGDVIACQEIRIASTRNRNYIRDLTVALAFDMLRRAILGLPAFAEYNYIKRTNACTYSREELEALS